MKKKLLFSFLVCVLSAICLFAACAKGTVKVTVLKSGSGVLVIRADETNTEAGLGTALNQLAGEGVITFESTNSEYGMYITSVNGKAAGADEYWAIYTTLTEYGGVTYSSEEFGTYTYGNVICNSASYGADGLPIIEGNLYILILEGY